MQVASLVNVYRYIMCFFSYRLQEKVYQRKDVAQGFHGKFNRGKTVQGYAPETKNTGRRFHASSVCSSCLSERDGKQ